MAVGCHDPNECKKGKFFNDIVMRVKTFFRDIHLWLSVPFGLVITLICFSGAMLVFEEDISRLVCRDKYYVDRVGERPLPMDELARMVKAALPDSVDVSGITVYSDQSRTYKVKLSRPRRSAVFVDQYTGEIKGRSGRLPFFDTIFRMHRWLLDTSPGDGGVFWGKMLVGVSTIVFVVILVTGVVVWCPRRARALRAALKINASKGFWRFAHGLHTAGGMYVLVLLLVMALTGLTWSFSWYRTAFYGVFGVDTVSLSGGHGRSAVADRADAMGKKRGDDGRRGGRGAADGMARFAHWQDVYDSLRRASPGAAEISVDNGTASVSFDATGNSRAADRYEFNVSTGRITSVSLYSDAGLQGKLRGWIYSVHVGCWGGWLTRVLWFLAALSGAVLPLTGYYLWIRRLLRGRK